MKLKGRLINETEGDRGARLIAPSDKQAMDSLWVPKSLMTYYKKFGLRGGEMYPLVHFEVERWFITKNSDNFDLFKEV